MAAYTTYGAVLARLGSVGLELRTDDDDATALVDAAIAYATGEIDFYCQGKYLASDLANNQYVQNAATEFALEEICQHRLNETPNVLADKCKRYRDQLDLVRQGTTDIPGCPVARRPATVTNYTDDLRRYNNQIRTDTARSTGVRRDYPRSVDTNAPDDR